MPSRRMRSGSMVEQVSVGALAAPRGNFMRPTPYLAHIMWKPARDLKLSGVCTILRP
jgi:hypothetical protein